MEAEVSYNSQSQVPESNMNQLIVKLSMMCLDIIFQENHLKNILKK